MAVVDGCSSGITLFTVGAGAALAADAAVRFVDARWLACGAPAPAAAPVRAPPPRPRRSKDPAAIIAANVFCSDCPARGADDGDHDATRLPGELIATIVPRDATEAFAVVKVPRVTGGGAAFSVYARGRPLAGHDAHVDHVEAQRVALRVGTRLEHLGFDDADAHAHPGPRPPRPRATR
jgi:hypothetical protein